MTRFAHQESHRISNAANSRWLEVWLGYEGMGVYVYVWVGVCVCECEYGGCAEMCVEIYVQVGNNIKLRDKKLPRQDLNL